MLPMVEGHRSMNNKARSELLQYHTDSPFEWHRNMQQNGKCKMKEIFLQSFLLTLLQFPHNHHSNLLQHSLLYQKMLEKKQEAFPIKYLKFLLLTGFSTDITPSNLSFRAKQFIINVLN